MSPRRAPNRRAVASAAVALAVVTGFATPAVAADPAPRALSAPRPFSGALARTAVRVVPPSGLAAAGRATGVLWELQLNLCDSGLASCYAELNNGRSVPEAYDLIRTARPDLVTLNEVCRADVFDTLAGALAASWPGDWAYASFASARDRRTGGPERCADGDEYGVGVLGHVPAARWAGVDAYAGTYPVQAADSTEQRAWLCVHVVGAHYACTTHLANSSGAVAASQCRYLLASVLPALWSYGGGPLPTVVGGDLNLAYGGRPDAQDCVPPGWFRKGDGDVQHVLATGGLTFGIALRLDLAHTDHPAWLVALGLA
jgi:hypothetical protein